MAVITTYTIVFPEVDLDECSGGTLSCSVMFWLDLQYFIIEINFSLVLNPFKIQ